ncbi:MAG TPA: class I SAM-dependent methyltransferase [Chitinophagaceae bacterium]|nr:class I SAM-dependent methyltransferase [Chitinophagaceae bacterium]
MPEKAWYRDWFNSPFYHKLYFERDEKEAEAFILKLLDHIQPGPGSRMLDLACGKGRHSKILASRGFHVTGIDISVKSIAQAQQFASENLEFFVHDMRLPFRINYFDYVFNFFTSFGYFRTRREHDDAIRTISNSLIAGGIFVIDYLNVHYAEAHLRPEEEKRLNGTTYRILRWHDEEHFFKKIVVEDASLTEPLEYTEKVAKFSFGDFTDMLAYQGMQIKEVFGDYNFSQYDIKKTPRLILVASKKPSKEADPSKRLYSDGRKTDALT